MSVRSVELVSSDEKYEPPSEVIELCVIGNNLFLSVHKVEDSGLRGEQVYDVPPIDVRDFLSALNAFADSSIGFREAEEQ